MSLQCLPPIKSSPEVMSSSPAIARSRVDFPQPDGPTKTTNSPSLISRSMPCNISRLPNDLRIPRKTTSDIFAYSIHDSIASLYRESIGQLTTDNPPKKSKMFIALSKQINPVVSKHDELLIRIPEMKQTGDPACFILRQMYRTATATPGLNQP